MKKQSAEASTESSPRKHDATDRVFAELDDVDTNKTITGMCVLQIFKIRNVNDFSLPQTLIIYALSNRECRSYKSEPSIRN